MLGASPVVKNIRRSRVDLLLNTEPNPFQDVSTFKRNLLIDLLIDGNIFVYFDGAHLYHLPAEHVTIHSDDNTYIEALTYIFRGFLGYTEAQKMANHFMYGTNERIPNHISGYGDKA